MWVVIVVIWMVVGLMIGFGGVVIVVVIVVVGGCNYCVFVIGWIWCECVGVGIGWVLVDVIVLCGWFGEMFMGVVVVIIVGVVIIVVVVGVVVVEDWCYGGVWVEVVSCGWCGFDECYGNCCD